MNQEPQFIDKCGVTIDGSLPTNAIAARECLQHPTVIAMGTPIQGQARRFWFYLADESDRLLELPVSYDQKPQFGVHGHLESANISNVSSIRGDVRWTLRGFEQKVGREDLEQLKRHYDAGTPTRLLEPRRRRSTAIKQPSRHTPSATASRWTLDINETPIGSVAMSHELWQRLSRTRARMEFNEEQVKDTLRHSQGRASLRVEGNEIKRGMRGAKGLGDLLYKEFGHHELSVIVGKAPGEANWTVDDVVRLPAARVVTSVRDRRGISVQFIRENWQIHAAKHPELATVLPHLSEALLRPSKIARSRDGPYRFQLYLSPELQVALFGSEGRSPTMCVVVAYQHEEGKTIAWFVTGYFDQAAVDRAGRPDARDSIQETWYLQDK